MVLPSLINQIFSPGLLKSLEQDIKRHERELPEETLAKDEGGMLSQNEGRGARELRSHPKAVQFCPCEGEREGRRVGEKESDTVVQFQESLSIGRMAESDSPG